MKKMYIELKLEDVFEDILKCAQDKKTYDDGYWVMHDKISYYLDLIKKRKLKLKE